MRSCRGRWIRNSPAPKTVGKAVLVARPNSISMAVAGSGALLCGAALCGIAFLTGGPLDGFAAGTAVVGFVLLFAGLMALVDGRGAPSRPSHGIRVSDPATVEVLCRAAGMWKAAGKAKARDALAAGCWAVARSVPRPRASSSNDAEQLWEGAVASEQQRHHRFNVGALTDLMDAIDEAEARRLSARRKWVAPDPARLVRLRQQHVRLAVDDLPEAAAMRAAAQSLRDAADARNQADAEVGAIGPRWSEHDVLEAQRRAAEEVRQPHDGAPRTHRR